MAWQSQLHGVCWQGLLRGLLNGEAAVRTSAALLARIPAGASLMDTSESTELGRHPWPGKTSSMVSAGLACSAALLTVRQGLIRRPRLEPQICNGLAQASLEDDRTMF